MDRGFAEFAEASSPRLMRLARTLAGNEHDACDLVQESLIRVGLKWTRVRPDGNPVGTR